MITRVEKRSIRAATKIRKKREREMKARDRRLINDFLPPEGVPIKFEVAGLGARLGAQIADLLLTIVFMLALIVLLFAGFAALDIPQTTVLGLAAILSLGIRAPYYIFAELFWNGRTLGKRMMRLRVVSADGRSLTAHSVVVRNLMKEVEVFMPGTYLLVTSEDDPVTSLILIVWISVVLAVVVLNRRRQRIGDMIAGTYVISQPEALLLPDLAAAPAPKAAGRFVFLPHQLDHYGAYELQTLEKILHAGTIPSQSAEAANRHKANMAAIIEKIRAKIDYAEPVSAADNATFLGAFYTAQRVHLEQRQLFGEKRADKFHSDETKA